jgi:hypothetical protein
MDLTSQDRLLSMVQNGFKSSIFRYLLIGSYWHTVQQQGGWMVVRSERSRRMREFDTDIAEALHRACLSVCPFGLENQFLWLRLGFQN